MNWFALILTKNFISICCYLWHVMINLLTIIWRWEFMLEGIYSICYLHHYCFWVLDIAEYVVLYFSSHIAPYFFLPFPQWYFLVYHVCLTSFLALKLKYYWNLVTHTGVCGMIVVGLSLMSSWGWWWFLSVTLVNITVVGGIMLLNCTCLPKSSPSKF